MSNKEGARLDIQRRVDSSEVVYRLSGELDPHTAPLLEKELLADGSDVVRVIIDLSAITFLDSAGVRVIVAAHERSAEVGQTFVLRAPSQVAMRVFDIAGLSDLLLIE